MGNSSRALTIEHQDGTPAMMTLFCFGLGYCAQRYVSDFGAAYDRVVGTSRLARSSCLQPAPAAGSRPVTVLEFDGTSASAEIAGALSEADRLLVSVPPQEGKDPVLAVFAGALARCPRLQSIVYLSTVGVYGDHGGGEVEETTRPTPLSARSRARLAAETAWRDLGCRLGKPVTILRLAGIYGPGRNTLVKPTEGRAIRIVKPGQVFNRIHVADVAQTIHAAFVRRADGIFNVTDEKPCSVEEVILYCASLLGTAPPAAVSFREANASMQPKARSFYTESKRARNDKLKRELGVRLIYPTYRAGMRALHRAGDHLPIHAGAF